MRNSSLFLLALLFVSSVSARPLSEMNRALLALVDLIPFISQKQNFVEKKNEKIIQAKMIELQSAFKSAKHDTLLKEDLFAPSYAIINDSISKSLTAFSEGKKDYAHWRLKEITSHCLDCHTRLPPSHTSSFQNGELKLEENKFSNVYNLGIAQLIVRRSIDAKNSFTRSIQDQLITKNFTDIMLPLKQILVIETKVLKDPTNSIAIFQQYADKKDLPEEVRRTLNAWISQLNVWKGKEVLKTGLGNEFAVSAFIKNELRPLKVAANVGDASDVDFLFASGLLSNYLFENPTTKKAPEINFWLGWAEKNLKRESFFGAGDLFLKQCIKRYPKDPMAKQCLAEYRESIEFEFSGSSGTHIPAEIEEELAELQKMIKQK